MRRPVAGQNHAVHTCALCGAQHRAQVARVGHRIQRQQKRGTGADAGGAPTATQGQQLLQLQRFQLGSQGHHALARLGEAAPIERLAPEFGHGHPLFPSELSDVVDDRRRIEVLRQEHLANLPGTGQQQFADRLATLHLIAAQSITGTRRTGATPTVARASRAR